jgi:hypothetical protein
MIFLGLQITIVVECDMCTKFPSTCCFCCLLLMFCIGWYFLVCIVPTKNELSLLLFWKLLESQDASHCACALPSMVLLLGLAFQF